MRYHFPRRLHEGMRGRTGSYHPRRTRCLTDSRDHKNHQSAASSATFGPRSIPTSRLTESSIHRQFSYAWPKIHPHRATYNMSFSASFQSPPPSPYSQASTLGSATPDPTPGTQRAARNAARNGVSPAERRPQHAMEEFTNALHVAALCVEHMQQFGQSVSRILEAILYSGDKVIQDTLRMAVQQVQTAQRLRHEEDALERRERQLDRILASLTRNQKARLFRCKPCRMDFQTVRAPR